MKFAILSLRAWDLTGNSRENAQRVSSFCLFDVLNKGLEYVRQVDEVLLNALNILHDFVLLRSDEFSPQKLNERFGEKAASVL